MKTAIKYLIVFLFILIANQGKAISTESDSLLGTYVGERWFRDWAICDTCWIISTDTLTIKKIDVEHCFSWVYGNIILDLAINYYAFDTGTEYGFCNENSYHWGGTWIKYYSTDSVQMNIYAISMPPPNTHAYGFRFYGKRISSKFLSVPKVKTDLHLANITSVGEEIIIETSNSGTGYFQLIDLSGRVLYKTKINSYETSICTPVSGLLLYRFLSEKGEVQTGKVVVQ